MRRSKIKLYLTLLISLVVISLIALVKLPIFKPIYLKIFGSKTVEEVIEPLHYHMENSYSDLLTLVDGKPITLIILKEEQRIELWKMKDSTYSYVDYFPFTNSSGVLGPKLERGDKQTPEGIYKIEYLNPNSRYHLSMKINYPNRFDRDMGRLDGREDLGDDIFIHGENYTIGCIPIGDRIEELFYIIARNGYQNSKVIISPYDMRVKSMEIEYKGKTWLDSLYKDIKLELDRYKKD